MQIFHQLIVQLIFLTVIIHLKVKMFMNKSTSLTKQSRIIFTTIFLTKDPPWFNNEIIKILTMKNKIFEQYIANGKSQTDYERSQLISNSLTETIRSSKEKFYCKLFTKLANLSTSSKTYWSVLRPVIPPLIVNNNLITNFLEKANLFNEFFSKKCQPL